jgi:type VI secretion system secreted protein VgrG
MSGWDRSRALLHAKSDLGDGVLMPVALSAHEEISQPFDFRVSIVSERPDIDPNEILHHGVTVAVQHDGVPVRHFHGIVQSFTTDGKVDGRDLTLYQARLVPRLWFLGQTEDCRIFQNKSVTDIVRAVAQEAGMPAPAFKLQNPHRPREYITQYNETDLAFISRLLQEEGAFYFFEHSDGDHEMVITDHNGAFRPLPGPALRFDSAVADDEVLTSWHRTHGTTHGRMRLIDYDPTAPKKRLDAQQQTILRAGGASGRDVFHWPALSHDPNRVRSLARYRLEADEAAVSLLSGEGRNRQLVPGASFTLAEDPVDQAKNKKVAIQSVSHEAWDRTFLSSDAGTGYTNRFSVFPLSVPWREPFAIARPQMLGVHAALVIGPKGTEIHTDDLGRAKVMFFWDHRREAEPDKAIWARVIYPWAGNGWGWQSTPRVGTEVAVAFMDGDPDRPVILGGMYNGDDKPIYSESEKTKSGIRTRSSLGGSSSNFNELTFDDKKGSELVYVQAEKDMRTLVKNDQHLTVNHCRVKHIKVDETITIGNNRTATIEKGNDSLTVSKGNLTIDTTLGKIDITAMQSITLTVGSSMVKIDQMGVTIKGMILNFEGSAMLQTKAPMTQLTAPAMMTLKAGIMFLN